MGIILGIDIGNVIIEGRGPQDTSFFPENFLNTPAVADAFYGIGRLVPLFDGTHLVSKCGENAQRKTRLWLEHNDFYQKTGVSPENVHFCLERADKAPICERLGITHFVDDKLEVLSYLTSVSWRYLFRPRDNEVKRYAEHLPCVTKRVESWSELVDFVDRRKKPVAARSMEIETKTTSDDEVFWTDDKGQEQWDSEKALSLMLANDGDLVVLRGSNGRIVIAVNCNDLFFWASSDAEEVPWDQIPVLFRAWKKEGWRGASKWACKHRKERPQKPIEKRWRDDGDWDDELEALPAK